MTNSEEISKLQGKKELLDSNGFANLDEFDISISALEENTKLKAEIERLNLESYELETQFNILMNKCNILEWNNSKFEIIIAELKSELEQSVKLPCKVGDTVYDNDFGSPTPSTIVGYSFGDVYQDSDLEMDMEQIYFYSKSNRFNIDMSFPSSEIGKTIFLTREGAEQHLKGKVEE